MYSDQLGVASRSMHRNEADVELCNYQQLPEAPDGPSPVDFIKEESLRFDAISDLDRFFERLYSYHREQGFWCIVTQWVLELLCLAFTILFSGFFLLFVNWHGLRNAKCGIAAAEAGTAPCDLSKEALYEHPLQPLTLYRFMVLIYLVIFSLYWLFCFLRFFTQLKETLEIRDFYHLSLGLTEHDVRTTPWPLVLEKIVQQKLSIVRHLSAHDIVMRIMRRENFMIGMVNKGVIALPLPHWVPGVGPALSRGFGLRKRLFLSKTLEWSLNWCVLQYMFDRRFTIQREFLDNPLRLKKRLRNFGICMLLLSPFLVVFMMVFFFLRHAEQFYHQPGSAASRRWSNLARWTFREFNELEHIFDQRLNASYRPATEYVKQFPSPIVTKVAKFFCFVFGGLVAVLIIITFLDETLLEAQLFGRKLFWVAAVVTTITAIAKQALGDENQVFDPECFMRYVAQHTHYMPKHWRGAEYTARVRTEFGKLFQYTAVILLEEMVSIVVTPYILIVHMPGCVDEILQFVRDYKETVPGVGDVCTLSIFDFEHHGNQKYCSPCSTSKNRRSNQGKMEKSFLSFKSNYPNWEPDAKGKQFLNLLAQFRMRHEDQVAATGTPHHLSMSSTLLRDTTLGSIREGSTFRYPYQQPHHLHQQQHHHPRSSMRQQNPSWSPRADCVVLSVADTNLDQMYWLDQYYTHRSMHGDDNGGVASSARYGGAHSQAPAAVQGEQLVQIIRSNPATRQARGWWARDWQGSGVGADGESMFQPPAFRGGARLPLQDSESEEEQESDWLKREAPGSFTSAQADARFELPFVDEDSYGKAREASADRGQPQRGDSMSA